MPRQRMTILDRIAYTLLVLLAALICLACVLSGCTVGSYGSETTDEWWPNGKQKSHTVKRNANATNIRSDAPGAVMDALDVGADFFTKHAQALLATTVPTILGGGVITGFQRSRAKSERNKLREKHEQEIKLARAQHEKDKADEYAAGVLAGKAGATA